VNGLHFERAFGDSMFELWKLKSAKLFDEMSQVTFDKFINNIDEKKMQAEVMFQVGAMVTSTLLLGKYGVILYGALTATKALLQQAEQDNIIRAKQFHSSEYEGKRTLSQKFWQDDWFGGMMYTALIGNPQAIFAPVRLTTDKREYEGEVILAPSSPYFKTEWNEELLLTINPFAFGEEYASNYDGNFNNKFISRPLNFHLISRNFMGYSDVHNTHDEDVIRTFLRNQDYGESKFHQEIAYAECSISYLENAISQETADKDEDTYTKILPFMYNYYPLFTFAPSESSIPYPEFFEDLPIVVSEEDYKVVKDEHNHIFKLWHDKESSIRVVPRNSVHGIDPSSIDEIDFYLVSFTLDNGNAVAFSYFEGHKTTIHRSDFTFVDGVIRLEPDIYRAIEQDYDDFCWKVDKYNREHTNVDNSVYAIFDVKIGNKYQSIESVNGAENIALMQSIQSSLMEYYYQAYLATESQSELNEVAYTVAVTLLTTIFSGGAMTKNIWQEPLEEVFIDETLDAVVSGFVRQCGGDKYWEVLLSSLAESARESAIGEAGSMMNQQQNQEQNLNLNQNQKISSKVKIALSSLAMFAGALFGLGVPSIIGMGSMSLIYQITNYAIDKKIKTEYKKTLQAKEAASVDRLAAVQAWLNLANVEAYDSVICSLYTSWLDFSMANQYKASQEQKAATIRSDAINKLLKLFPEVVPRSFNQRIWENPQKFFVWDIEQREIVLEFMAEQIRHFEKMGEQKYSVFEVAESAGVDVATAQKQIYEYLVKIFGDADFAAEYYGKAFSKEFSVVQLSDGSWIVEGYEVDGCNKFAFTRSDSSQGVIVKEIHLPKGISLASAIFVVQKAFSVNPSADVDLYIGDQKIESIAVSTTLLDIINILGGESIEVRSTQSDAYNTLKTIYEKTKKGKLLSSIEQSLWDRGAREMGGEEKISEIEKVKNKHPKVINKIDIIVKYLKENLGDDINKIINNEIQNLRTTKSLKEEMHITHSIISEVFKAYIIDVFGTDYLDLIIGKFWSNLRTGTNLRKESLYKILDNRLKNPDQQGLSQNELIKNLHIGKSSVRVWTKEYLFNKIIEDDPYLDVNLVESLIDKIYSGIFIKNRPIPYEDIKSFVQMRRGTLITTKAQFDKQSDIPTKRVIQIKCEKGHIFNIRVEKILYSGRWCPQCNEYKCETIMGWFMDKIFSVNFEKQVNLKKIYNLPVGYSKEIICDKNNAFKYKVHITRQSFDGYLEFNVKGIDKNGNEVEKLVRVAFEYDGKQHDEYIDDYHHRDITNFYKQRCRDIAKNEEAKLQDTIIIRLKESRDFDFSTLNTFQEEIIKQFQEKSGIKLLPMVRYYYDSKKNDVIMDSSQIIDIPLSSNSNQIQKKQSKISNYLGDLD